MALGAVNERYLEEAQRWEQRLTKVKKPDINATTEFPAKSTPAVSVAGKSRTLTNTSSSTPAPDGTPPKSAKDYQALAIAALKNLPG